MGTRDRRWQINEDTQSGTSSGPGACPWDTAKSKYDSEDSTQWEDVGNARTDAQPADGHDLQDVTEIHTYMISQLGIGRC